MEFTELQKRMVGYAVYKRLEKQINTSPELLAEDRVIEMFDALDKLGYGYQADELREKWKRLKEGK